ncbi:MULTISPECIES: hypothetical protein [Sinorhizobium]|uniref:hypothetical protein n=1 Tax=Sinorhizobium TaxID=28105 RepID=UPI000FD48567|nr:MULTISPECIES: hypothetical protein [Sinorhizobium]RVJ16525.1 hypothetical protein CN184_28470 [Sinorhizobium medicae]RVM15371.1 hypothetical protein CN134_14255 [Sinorhizobium meliloti]RVO31077.1 hypothetical protein CN098_13920 [Sinorhizobium meliloti]GCA50644.1 hypothetical protein KGO5_03091 [Sinorhizobium sp. KGO-5]
MAIAQLLYGNIDSESDVLTSDFDSVELNTGETYEFVKASRKYLIVNALADIYVAFTSDGSTPNAAAQPRCKIVSGSSFPFAIRTGIKITVIAA